MKHIHNQRTQRITSQQQAIFTIVKKQVGHITADQVFKEVRKSLPRVSLATVYRNLEKLTDNGLIGRAIIRGVYYFELETSPHYHVVCLSCGAVGNIESSPATDIEGHFSRATEFKLTGHELVLYGICQRCQNKR